MDEFESELSRMLKQRVGAMPDAYEVTSRLLARTRRRRATKVAALAASIVIVASGTTAAVAQVVGHHGSHRLVASAPTTTATTGTTSTTVPTSTTVSAPPDVATTTLPGRVSTVACPVTYSLQSATPLAPPSTGARIAPGVDPALVAGLSSFAATTDPRYIALGPSTWSCQTSMATDGDNGMVVYKTASPPAAAPDLWTAPIAIENDWLWHGGVGLGSACRVTDDPLVVQNVTQLFPEYLPCPIAGRTLSKLDANVTMFVDADGARGVSWIVPPSSQGADDGQISVLTCRPTADLTTGTCDTIVGDYAVRLSAEPLAH